jgi:hypothetical protein
MKSQSQMHPKPRTLQFLFLFFAKMSLDHKRLHLLNFAWGHSQGRVTPSLGKAQEPASLSPSWYIYIYRWIVVFVLDLKSQKSNIILIFNITYVPIKFGMLIIWPIELLVSTCFPTTLIADVVWLHEFASYLTYNFTRNIIDLLMWFGCMGLRHGKGSIGV